jgi:acetoacetyl-CoA synthetase
VTTDEILWTPTPASIAKSRSGRYLDWLKATGRGTFPGYPELWRWSVMNLPDFWRSIWDHFEVIGDGDRDTALVGAEMPDMTWFPDARLNYAENMLRGPSDQPVLVALSQTREQITMTRGELRDAVARTASGLRKHGVSQNDRVVGYLPNIPETLIAMLATVSLGAIWAVCAPEMGTQSVLDRLQQLDPTVLLAADGYRYGDKDIDRTDEVATLRAELPTDTTVIHVPYLGGSPAPDGTIAWPDLLAEAAEPHYTRVPFDHPLWVVFSSGTTGLPKAILQSHGGITLEMNKSLGLHSDVGPEDRYFVFTTTSWVMWNIQVSALLLGSAIVLFDGNPAHPAPDRLWQVVAEHNVTVFGCGAAFLAAQRKAGVRPGAEFDLSVLRGMFVTGSPLPTEGFHWVYEAIGPDLFLQSASGGTDVCTCFVGGTPLLPVRAGEIAAPQLGVHACAFDDTGSPIVDQMGELVVTTPMPSMPVGFWNDPDKRRYRATYFDKYPGTWRHGDWVVFNSRGASVISGRSDGTLNRGGVRLGTSEFYSVLEDIPEISDSLIVHVEDTAGGMGDLVLFVVPTTGADVDDALRGRITGALRDRLSPRHVPDHVIAAPAIPYNLTNKKLEVPVKRILQGESVDRTVSPGALRNPESIGFYEQLAQRFPRPVTA